MNETKKFKDLLKAASEKIYEKDLFKVTRFSKYFSKDRY